MFQILIFGMTISPYFNELHHVRNHQKFLLYFLSIGVFSINTFSNFMKSLCKHLMDLSLKKHDDDFCDGKHSEQNSNYPAQIASLSLPPSPKHQFSPIRNLSISECLGRSASPLPVATHRR